MSEQKVRFCFVCALCDTLSTRKPAHPVWRPFAKADDDNDTRSSATSLSFRFDRCSSRFESKRFEAPSLLGPILTIVSRRFVDARARIRDQDVDLENRRRRSTPVFQNGPRVWYTEARSSSVVTRTLSASLRRAQQRRRVVDGKRDHHAGRSPDPFVSREGSLALGVSFGTPAYAKLDRRQSWTLSPKSRAQRPGGETRFLSQLNRPSHGRARERQTRACSSLSNASLASKRRSGRERRQVRVEEERKPRDVDFSPTTRLG